MADIDGLFGYNPQAQNQRLFAAFGNDIVNVNTNTGYSANITSGNKAEFASFLNKAWFLNGKDGLLKFNNTNWTNQTTINNVPNGFYIQVSPRNRLLIANIQLGLDGTTYPSRVWFSDLPKFGDITWGFEYASDLSQTAGSKIVTSVVGRFIIKNIKVGDPFTIQSGANAGEYTVASIDTDRQITLVETLNSSATNSIYWVGSNFFDVLSDNSDEITGLGENSDRDLIFKLLSLFRYDGVSLRKLKDAVGTSSHRSITNHKGTTYYFHGSDPKISGIYMTDGITSTKISKPIDPYIQGMSTSNYTEVVAWKEGEEVRFFLGDISNPTEGISITNAVATLDTTSQGWDVGPISDIVKVATNFRTGNRLDWYVGTSDSQVLKMASGYNFNGSPIPFAAETKIFYPSGSEVQNEYPYIQVISKNAKGVKVKYKLWDHPKNVDDQWLGLGEITNDLTEFTVPLNHLTSAGIQFRFEEDGSLENDYYLEKISVFYKPNRTRLL